MSSLAPRGGLDFWSGLLLVAIAGFAIWLVSDLEVGSARDMGPAYFPLAVAILLAGMGVVMLVRGVLVRGPSAGGIELRPLLAVLASFLAFGLLIRPAGLVIAILAQVGIAHFATPETRPLQSLLFGLALSAVSAVLFVYLLRVPVSVLP
jgi:putative tricarboxylic transport membrane protein